MVHQPVEEGPLPLAKGPPEGEQSADLGIELGTVGGYGLPHGYHHVVRDRHRTAGAPGWEGAGRDATVGFRDRQGSARGVGSAREGYDLGVWSQGRITGVWTARDRRDASCHLVDSPVAAGETGPSRVAGRTAGDGMAYAIAHATAHAFAYATVHAIAPAMVGAATSPVRDAGEKKWRMQWGAGRWLLRADGVSNTHCRDNHEEKNIPCPGAGPSRGTASTRRSRTAYRATMHMACTREPNTTAGGIPVSSIHGTGPGPVGLRGHASIIPIRGPRADVIVTSRIPGGSDIRGRTPVPPSRGRRAGMW